MKSIRKYFSYSFVRCVRACRINTCSCMSFTEIRSKEIPKQEKPKKKKQNPNETNSHNSKFICLFENNFESVCLLLCLHTYGLKPQTLNIVIVSKQKKNERKEEKKTNIRMPSESINHMIGRYHEDNFSI